MKVGVTALCILSAMVTPTFGEPPDTVFLEELTGPELRTFVQTGKTTMILPIDGTEQSGPHMALGKHNARVRVLSVRIVRTPQWQRSKHQPPTVARVCSWTRRRASV